MGEKITAKFQNAVATSRALFCIINLFFLGSCTPLSVHNYENDFEGLDAAVSRCSATGGTLRVLFIHGMGHHAPGYSGALMQGIAERLRLDRGDTLPEISISKENHHYGVINIANYFGSNHEKVRVYELTWSATTDAIKQRQFTNDDTYASSRVLINRELKAQLINDALADPVLYIGRYRNHMQFPLMRAVKAVVNDYQPQDEIAIVTQSLGSYMCYDTLLKMSRGEKIMGEKPFSANEVQDLIGHVNYVFMLANQLPLLELSEVSNPLPLRHASNSAVKELAEIRRQHRPKSILRRQVTPLTLHLVAFGDPNDLLSYPLDKSSVSGESITYSNVVISIERSAILGVVASPLTAHTGHEKSKQVMDLLAFGHKDSGALKVAEHP